MFRIFLLALALLALRHAAAVHEGYYNYPDLYGDRIVFASEGDLWLVPVEGGRASRLTSGAGLELLPKFSPDGAHIAFVGEYAGSLNLHVIPSEGGEPRQLTWHPYSQIPSGWSPDGKEIFFASASHHFAYDRETFRISVDGGVPLKLPVGTASYLKMAPDGKTVVFNRNYVQPRTWKRYMGGLAGDIWLGDLESGEFRQLTEYPGNDFNPLIAADRFFFTSERNGRLNLWSMDRSGGDLQQHTDFEDFDVRYPETDGGNRIVFQKGADIYLYDIGADESRKVEILLPTDRPHRQARLAPAEDFVNALAVSNDGKKTLITTRGDVWNIPVEAGAVRPVAVGSSIRQDLAVFGGAKNELAVYFSDDSDDYEIYTKNARMGDNRQQVTNPDDPQRGFFQPFFSLEVSPDGEAVAFADQAGTLYWTNLTTKTLNVVDDSRVWKIRDYQWSPDNRYLAYAKPVSPVIDRVYIHDTATSTSIAVSDPAFDSYSPSWDPGGEFLYFVSERTYNRVNSDLERESTMIDPAKIYALPLRKDIYNPFVKRDPYLEDDESENGDEEEEEEDADSEEIEIDYDSIIGREFEFPIEAGNYTDLYGVKGKVFAYEWDEKKLMTFELKPEMEPKVFLDDPARWNFSVNGEQIVYMKNGKVRVAKSSAAESSDDDPEALMDGIRLRVDPAEEWRQIFEETYRYQRDYFYDPEMANQDWKEVQERYSPLLERISTRLELSAVLGNLIAELGHGHTYVLSDGDAPRPAGIGIGLLGADFGVDYTTGTVTLEKIYRGEQWNRERKGPLNTPETVSIPDGAHLLAVNGEPVTLERDPNSFFWGLAGKDVILTISENGDPNKAKDYVVTLTNGGDTELRLHEWVEGNRRYTAEQSDGEIGYIYLPNMSTEGLKRFFREFYPQIDRKAMVVDIRWNGGGNVSQLLIRRLAAELYATMTVRNFEEPLRYPGQAFAGPLACLINQRCGSDGDIFARSFRLFEMGPLIGTRTWGGTIGIRSHTRYVDGSVITVPEFAFADMDRGYDIENNGVVPDPGFEIDLRPEDLVAGADPQLDAAIEYLSDEMQKPEYGLPEAPEPLDRSVESHRRRGERWMDLP